MSVMAVELSKNEENSPKTAEITHDVAVTPMMRQYLDTKAQYPDYLLFYRMGDFYELFFDDAVIAASVLNIALTKRGKHQENEIPMCGVPWHSYEPYLHKLIKSGHKVAVCEQMETPQEAKKRGYKAVVNREVVRIITPGTLVEDSLLEARRCNYLVSLVAAKSNDIALAWIDMSTGEFMASMTSKQALQADLARLNPAEILLSEAFMKEESVRQILQPYQSCLTLQVQSLFEYQKAKNKLEQIFAVATLDSFGSFAKEQLIACGALLEYVSITQKGQLPRLNYPKMCANDQFMAIDAATRRNLEIEITLSGQRQGSLLHTIDRTITSAGARLLRNYMAAPLTSSEMIDKRLDMIHFLLNQSELRVGLRHALTHIPDLERALSRICADKAGPYDMLAIANALKQAVSIRSHFESLTAQLPLGLTQMITQLGRHGELADELLSAFKEEPSRLVRDGQFIATGYHPRLDELRSLAQNGKQAIQELRDHYREMTGVTSLKITHNNVLGYYIEITALHAKKLEHTEFSHRQTLANVMRYTTQKLRDLEQDILHAAEEALTIELQLFQTLAGHIKTHAETIALEAQALASLDVMTGLALLAMEQHYVRPIIDDSKAFIIKNGRHPVVEAFLAQTGQSQFVANDCDLSPNQRLWLLTGPNMAGKSTYLRQNALITLLAQMGSYVPATYAHIGVVDKLFSRVGASDDLAHGRSTFMVEMVETATILNQATPKSLVILDEIGRGTATYDGLSIAWAVAEHLHHHNKSRGLFATHYHELTNLRSQLSAMACYTMKVKEWEGEVVFMHQVIAGPSDRSYGIHVAKLAGLPKNVIKRATDILHNLEVMEEQKPKQLLTAGLPLFAVNRSQEVIDTGEEDSAEVTHPVLAKLETLKMDELSPKEALDVLYELKALCNNQVN